MKKKNFEIFGDYVIDIKLKKKITNLSRYVILQLDVLN